jgi:hypothetical protein
MTFCRITGAPALGDPLAPNAWRWRIAIAHGGILGFTPNRRRNQRLPGLRLRGTSRSRHRRHAGSAYSGRARIDYREGVQLAALRAAGLGLAVASLFDSQTPAVPKPVDAQEELAVRSGLLRPGERPCVVILRPAAAVAQRADASDQYRASIVAATGTVGQAQTIDVVIENWPSPQTEEQLHAMLALGSQNAFLDALMNAETIGTSRWRTDPDTIFTTPTSRTPTTAGATSSS